MLQDFFCFILQTKKFTVRIIFEQGGASAHFAKTIRSWLNDKFDNGWVWRAGPTS